MVSTLPEYYVRKVTLEDLKHAEQASQVFMDAYNSKEEGWTSVSKTVDYYRVTKEDMEKSIKQSLEGKSTQYFAFQRLSDVEEVVIGTILVTPTYRDQEGNVLPGEGYVGNFSVDPKIQSKGIGGKLMRAAMDQLKEENFSHCVIWVFENRVELIDWYKKLGFEDTLELVAWDIPTDSNLILDVKFAVMKLKL